MHWQQLLHVGLAASVLVVLDVDDQLRVWLVATAVDGADPLIEFSVHETLLLEVEDGDEVAMGHEHVSAVALNLSVQIQVVPQTVVQLQLVAVCPVVLLHVEVDTVAPVQVDLVPSLVGPLNVELVEVSPHITCHVDAVHLLSV